MLYAAFIQTCAGRDKCNPVEISATGIASKIFWPRDSDKNAFFSKIFWCAYLIKFFLVGEQLDMLNDPRGSVLFSPFCFEVNKNAPVERYAKILCYDPSCSYDFQVELACKSA